MFIIRLSQVQCLLRVDWNEERHGPVGWSCGNCQRQPRSMLEGQFGHFCFHAAHFCCT